MKPFAALIALLTIPLLHALEPGDLRCDWGKDPLGIDSAPPRLSWKLKPSPGDPTDARQAAWQILAASSEEKLATGTGDLWDSGRVAGGDQLHVPYAGSSLAASQQVFWKVRAWKNDGEPGAWSPPARWTMGLPAASDWSGARWLTDPELLKWRRGALGYRSQPATRDDEVKWIQIDLGQQRPIDSVVLHGLRHTVAENLGFPHRFKVEAASTSDFKDAVMIADQTAADFRNPWATRIELKTKDGPITARYLRLTATRLRTTDGEICLALSQIVVRSGGKNVAPGASVTASDSIEGAKWSAASVVDGIGEPGVNPLANSTILLKRDFKLPSPVTRAVLHVSGLGQCRVSLNGTDPAEDSFLTTGWTRYDRTCLYQTLDVTRALKAGNNTLTFSLAGGTYNVQDGRYVKFVTDFRPLTAIALLCLEFADGSTITITTDDQWQVAAAPTTFSNLFGGEDFDAGKTPGPWRPAVAWEGPGGTLRGFSHASPPFAGHETFTPQSSREIRPGTVVHDFGQNTAMVLNLRVKGPRGASVKITPGELLKNDGSVDRASSGGKNVWWDYTLSGNEGGESWSPRFFYQGCRYVQVETSPAGETAELPVVEKIESVVAHSDSAPAGDFTCSSELFNRIRTLVRWAQRSNLAHVLTDCPHRERLGWLEQYHLNGPALRYETDLTRLYAKTFGDMADAQEPNGFIPNVAPESIVFSGDFRASPEWSASVILAAWQHYAWTGDDTPLRGNYQVMARYLEDLARRADGHILDYGLGDWYDVGPKPPGFAQLTPRSLTATAIYQECVSRMGDIAEHLGKADDSRRYAELARSIGEAFNQRFLDPQTGVYATGSQTAQAMPLVLGLVPDELRGKSLAALVANIESGGHAVTAGDIGYRYVLRALAQAGRSDVVFAMVNQTEKPGYGYQLAQGATSLTEAWSALRTSSQNHFMLGQVTEWFYGDLAGLAPDPQAPGWRNIIVRPQPVGDITSASASHETPLGTASVKWTIRDGKFELTVRVPVGSTADVTLPYGTAATRRVGPGEHQFSASL